MRYLFLAVFLFAAPAVAETNTYDASGTYSSSAAAQEQEHQRKSISGEEGLIVPSRVDLALTPQGKSSDMVGLRFSVPDVVNGCWRISPLEVKNSMQGPYYFDVEVVGYHRSEGQCSGENRMARAVVPIERSKLEQGKIKILRLSIGPVTDRFEVTYKDGTMTIMPQSAVKFRTDGLLSYNFDRDGKGTGQMIALILPTAPVGMNTTAAADDFARIYGLTPAPESATSSMPRNNGGSTLHYYYDVQKTLAHRVGANFAQMGQTNIPMTLDMQDGRGQQMIAAPVYAKLIE